MFLKSIEVIYPGISFFCFVILLCLSFLQIRLYLKFRFKRSKYLSLFCFLSSIYTVNVTIVYGELLSVEATRFFVIGFHFILFISYYYYLKSLSFFIMIPRFLRKIYFKSMFLFAGLSLFPPIFLYVFDIHIYFDPNSLFKTGNFFLDAYSTRLGTPYKTTLIALSLFAALNVYMSLYLLNRLRKFSKDNYLVFGLCMNLFAFGMEYLILPFTYKYYVPILFLANIFEAFRMCFLDSRETLVIMQERGSKEETFKDTGLVEEEFSRLSERLLDLMDNEKLYLDPQLNVDKLARRLKIPNYLVSQVIRFSLDKTFNQLLIEYRVDEAKMRLQDKQYKGRTILEVAQDSGFNSKSSFNASFKKQAGETPSEYRKRF